MSRQVIVVVRPYAPDLGSDMADNELASVVELELSIVAAIYGLIVVP